MIAEKMVAERDVDPLQARHFLRNQQALEVARRMRLGCGGRGIPQIRQVSSPRACGPDRVVKEKDERRLALSDLR